MEQLTYKGSEINLKMKEEIGKLVFFNLLLFYKVETYANMLSVSCPYSYAFEQGPSANSTTLPFNSPSISCNNLCAAFLGAQSPDIVS